ncbi:MAG: PAS domain-containing protein [Candidatus Pacebacteria bacterium]|nr:PAS domain-containing protein [Candidatus Paceibacterota bacterium]
MKKEEIEPLFSFLKEGVVVFDKDFRVGYINNVARTVLDVDSIDIVGSSVTELLEASFEEQSSESKGVLQKKVLAIFDGDFVKNNAPIEVYVRTQTKKTPVNVQVVRINMDGGENGVVTFYDLSNEQELKSYRSHTKEVLSTLVPVLRKTALGDFSSKIDVPEDEEDEFAELLVGVQLMIDDLVELSAKKEELQQEEVQTIKQTETQLTKKVENTTQELQQAKKHIETIVENLTQGLIEYDGSFQVRRINSAAEEMLDVKREDVLGIKVLPEDKDHERKKNLAIVSYPVLATEGRRVTKKTFGENASVHELVITHPVKKELEVVTIPFTHIDTGERDGFIKVIRDITKEREISRSKSDFINIAAHQLRTPLSAVKWVMSMILDGDYGSLSPSQRKLIDKGYKTNEKMITLVNDLLNVARIEDDRFGYVFKEGDIVAAITDVVDEFRLLAEKGNIDLIFEKPNNVPVFVFDFSKIQLALHNLIGNAIKYTHEGGTVRVSLEKKDEMIVIQIQDTGIGIPKDQIKMMFTKFFRAGNVIRLQVGGSGLGLFIVKDIVARHGGSITVESIEDEGTMFILKIPIKAARSEDV